MKIKKLKPECNLATVRDGRGGIFTFYPTKPILEFSYIFIKARKIRGNHYHPEFDEYFFLVEGNGVLVNIDKNGKEDFIYLSKGEGTFNPSGESHVFYAITDSCAIAMLTKKWDDCKRSIVHQNLGMGMGDHGDPKHSKKKEDCPCPVDCDLHGHCQECIIFHREQNELPFCLKMKQE